jgi:23S rRNA G2445 N2-methylase RlmL
MCQNENPIVNFSEDLVKRGMKKLERKLPDVDKFLAELEEMCSIEDGRIVVNGDTEALYERYPDVRVGIRRAMLVVEKKLRKSGD